MKQRSFRGFDLKVRLGGAGLILLGALCLSLLPARRDDPAARPSTIQFFVALAAVCSGSVGASFLSVGRQMFDPVPDPCARQLAQRYAPRDEM